MVFGIIQPALVVIIKEQFQTATAQTMAAMSFASEAFCTFIPTLGALSFTYIIWNSSFLIIGGIAFILFIKIQPVWAQLSLKPVQLKSITYRPDLKNLTYTSDFLKFNAISFLMNGLCWGTTIISAYLFDYPVVLHGLFYSTYRMLYALGNLIGERRWMGIQKILQVFPYAIFGIGILLGYGFFSSCVTVFTIAVLLFGLLAGLIYGPVIAKALAKIDQADIDLASTFFIFRG